jgi:hypothetical protein
MNGLFTSSTATATEGLIISVINDATPKNNGIYYVSSVALNEGEKGSLVKAGGSETETAEDYSKAVELSNNLTVGQLIKVEKEYKENEGKENEITYQKGFYIVEAPGVISALSTSTGADDEVGALKGRVDSLESVVGDSDNGLVKDVNDLKSINHDAYIDADTELKNELQSLINSKVSQDAYDEKISDIEDSIASAKTLSVELSNAAQSAAESHADDLNSLMNARVEALEEIDHKHENMTVLDGITSTDIEKWNNAQSNVIEKIIFNGEEIVVYPPKYTNNAGPGQDPIWVPVPDILIENISIFFGHDLNAIVDDTFKIHVFDEDEELHSYAAAEGDSASRLLYSSWFNKSEANEFIGFSDGVVDETYSEQDYSDKLASDWSGARLVHSSDIPPLRESL